MCERCGLKIPEGETAADFAARFARMRAEADAAVFEMFAGCIAEEPPAPPPLPEGGADPFPDGPPPRAD